MKESRSRAWTFIVYPESAPENWVDILEDLHIEWVQSPLHEFDVNPDGEVKKAHWHILVQFTNVKSYDQVNEIGKLVKATVPQRCHNTRALVRYFCHLDNPDKFQYDVKDIIPHGGADVEDLLKPSHAMRQSVIADMMAWCKKEQIDEFQDLYDYSRLNRRDDWFIVLNDSAVLPMKYYLSSMRHRTSRFRVTESGKLKTLKEVKEEERKEAEEKYNLKEASDRKSKKELEEYIDELKKKKKS